MPARESSNASLTNQSQPKMLWTAPPLRRMSQVLPDSDDRVSALNVGSLGWSSTEANGRVRPTPDFIALPGPTVVTTRS
jgi:hypothetical protein